MQQEECEAKIYVCQSVKQKYMYVIKSKKF